MHPSGFLLGWEAIFEDIRKGPSLFKIKIPPRCLEKFLFLLSKSMSSQFLYSLTFSSRKQRNSFPCLLLFLKLENRMPLSHLSKFKNIFLDISFNSQNWGKEFQISLSLLETGENNLFNDWVIFTCPSLRG